MVLSVYFYAVTKHSSPVMQVINSFLCHSSEPSPPLTPFEALCTAYSLNPDVHKTVIHLPSLGSGVLVHHIVASGCGGCEPNIPKRTL